MLDRNEKIWTEKEEKFLSDNYAFGNINKIAKKLHRTKKAITERAKVLKLRRDKHTTHLLHRKNSINEYFFHTWTNEMAYIYGFICTDGCLGKSKNGWSIEINQKDMYILERMNKYMNSKYKLRLSEETRDTGYVSKMVKLSVHSIIMCEQLMKLNITPRKSRTLQYYDKIPDEFFGAFIRGVFDGDGCILKSSPRAKISTASRSFAYGISKQLNELKIENKIIEETLKDKYNTEFFTVRILKKQSIKNFYDLMYSNCGDLYLERKKKIFEDHGVLDYGFCIKSKIRMRPIIAYNDREILFFPSAEEARSKYKKIFDAIKYGKIYHGYYWEYNKAYEINHDKITGLTNDSKTIEKEIRTG